MSWIWTGTGKTETISYKDTSVTDKGQWKLPGKGGDLPGTGAPFQSGERKYSYYWSVSYCTMKDGKTCLLAASVSDNDWTAELLLLSQEDEDSLTIVGIWRSSPEKQMRPPKISFPAGPALVM